MTHFLLVRHGLPVSGVTDPPLTADGLHNSELLGRWLAHNQRIDHVASSPMLRAVQTASGVLAGLGGDQSALTVIDALHELEPRGSEDDAYFPSAELQRKLHPTGAALLEGRYDDVQPRAEWDRYRELSRAALDALLGSGLDGSVVAVAHGGVINGILSLLLKTHGVFHVLPEYTSVTRFERLDSGNLVLRSVNETPHLAAWPKPQEPKD